MIPSPFVFFPRMKGIWRESFRRNSLEDAFSPGTLGSSPCPKRTRRQHLPFHLGGGEEKKP